MAQLTTPQIEVLRAYLNGGTHKRHQRVTDRLLRRGYLEPKPGKPGFFPELRISRKGIDALDECVGTKALPAKIKVAQYFYVECPSCAQMLDCDDSPAKIECPACGRVFYTDFNLQDCGL